MNDQNTEQNSSTLINRISRPLFIALTLIAVFGVAFQIILPEPFIESQETVRDWLVKYNPWDSLIFIGLQALQVIIAPISHYTIALIGGFVYGPALGGLYNYIGRMLGHIAAYWIGRSLQGLVIKIFNPDDFKRFQKFTNGNEKTLWIRLMILFLMIFLPLFPDDEISYLVGLAGIRFRYYFWVLLFGHIGGSWALAYIGAGATQDPMFFGLLIFGVLSSIAMIIFVKKLGQNENTEM